MKRNSILELLHPDGNAKTSFVLGSNSPEDLFPQPLNAVDQQLDIIILAPTAKECRSEGWLESAAKFVDQHLAQDGVCYMLVPWPWRLKMIRLLSRVNLRIDSAFWHFPDWFSSLYLVPFQQAPLQFAVDRIISGPVWKRVLAREIFRSSLVRNFFGAIRKSVGVSIRRPRARSVFQWLFSREDQELRLSTAIVRKSWRTSHNIHILYCFTDRNVSPSAIVKTTTDRNSFACLDHEAEILDQLRSSVRASGARVPRILRKEENDHRSSLFLSPLKGKPAADLLASHADQLLSLLEEIVSWLERWHSATVKVQPLNVRLLEQNFLALMEQLVSCLPNAEVYRAWLEDRIRSAVGTPFPFVATHNDLTMANLLVDDDVHLGVVDWETGNAASWPLVDFYYAVTDAVRIAQGYSSWLDAFKACYQPGGLYAEKVHRWEKQLRSATELSSDAAELCFHACWLHHASNENEVSHSGDSRPFLEIVQWLALNYAKPGEN